jgi:hypothetical protein
MKFIKIKSKNLICFEGEDADGLLDAALLYKDQDGNSYPESDWEVGEASEKEIMVLLAKQDSDNEKYDSKRMREYPTIEELIVALYDTDDKAAIDKRRADVKKKYPKPA